MASPDLGMAGNPAHADRKRSRRGPHLFRYVGADDSGAPENSFLVRPFRYIDALAARGRAAEAREPFENMLACRNHLGLLSGRVEANTNEL